MKRRAQSHFLGFLMAGVCFGGPVNAASPALQPPTTQQVQFFETKIRPVLVEHCYKCHSAQTGKNKGGLELDTRTAMLAGGEGGPAVVPGDPKNSRLIEAISYEDEDFQMPPKKSGGKLSDSVIADFTTWVKMGAPDPRLETGKDSKKPYDTTAARSWWSYQPLQNPAVPSVTPDTWAHNDIDRFILASQGELDLKPVADADKATLLRRVYFDLIGLPPPPEEMKKFLAASSTFKAYEAIVDKLLASPQFGECWARHWLDVARYAESSGKDINITYPQAWRYRDYVIESFNNDTPYDTFIQQQIAGDLLPAKDDAERARNLIATGFLAIGTKSFNEMNSKQFAVDQADEQVSTVSMAILATTMGCARCHDHKFDPISQRDYTSVAGIFLSTETRYGTSGGQLGRNSTSLLQLPKDANLPVVLKPLSKELVDQKKKELADLRDQVKEAIAERRAAVQDGADRKAGEKKAGAALTLIRLSVQAAELESELANYDDSGNPIPLAMGVTDKPTTSADRVERRGPTGRPRRNTSGFEMIGNSPLFSRGDIEKPGDSVNRGIPALLSGVEGSPVPQHESGRLELANWITSPKNPLVSRVIVNRAWHYLFGNGIVRSVDNFGTTGDRPTHSELLDYLASNFVSNGWSIKTLVRQIVLSHTYQLSTLDNKEDFAIDPDNKLLWRQNPRRLDAECIRDAMLAASGTLDLKPLTGSLIARAGDGPVGGGKLRPITDNDLINQDSDHRSIYLAAARNDDAELLSVFDYPDASAPLGAREATNVPSQALFMMNSELVAKQSRKLAERIIKAYPGQAMDRFSERFNLTHQLIFSHENDRIGGDQARRILVLYPKDPVAGWTSICRAMFASSTFRYLN